MANALLLRETLAAQQEERRAFTDAEKIRRAARKAQLASVQENLAAERKKEIEKERAWLQAALQERDTKFIGEHSARKVQAQLQKEECTNAVVKAVETVSSARARGANEVRRMRLRDMVKSDVRALDKDKMILVSKQLNASMGRLFKDPNETRAWAKLFRYLDDDDSGLISLAELKRVVRDILGLSSEAFPENDLQSLWRSLDDNDSGTISIGEFGAFMRLGEDAPIRVSSIRLAESCAIAAREQREIFAADLQEESTARAREKEERRQCVVLQRETLQSAAKAKDDLLSARRQQADEIRRLKAALPSKFANVGDLDGDSRASISKQLNKAMFQAFKDPNETRAWAKLFRYVDVDDSGLISYEELKHVVRNVMSVPADQFPEEMLQKLWNSLDDNKSGFISIGEFGAFMKIGELDSMNTSRELRKSAREETLANRVAENRTQRQALELSISEARAEATAEVVKAAHSAREARRQASEQAARATEERRKMIAARARADAEATAAELKTFISEAKARAANATGKACEKISHVRVQPGSSTAPFGVLT